MLSVSAVVAGILAMQDEDERMFECMVSIGEAVVCFDGRP